MSTQRAEAVLSSEECSLSTMQGHWILAERGRGRLDASLGYHFKYRGYKSKV